ncbi:hypothetical protein EI427_13270 [Flammeovirga pectinis]|uniref:Uncharacterized protein n=1 Tax=Flammeovirga pectinis TaxID=2494373 RepID=A0A3Q9FMV3_9BACT|nr:hypothetical protein [Flammeovirga pectinis]AZQ63173.1 hypothetical protein EI427_13270 [Flammeovirga pectinis]
MNAQTPFKLETKRLLLQEFSKTYTKGFFDLNKDWDVIKYTCLVYASEININQIIARVMEEKVWRQYQLIFNSK